ncbi:MAG: SusC/RagA family TonB-linked outer membrane protein [Gemmatimonadaceae bacterium]
MSKHTWVRMFAAGFTVALAMARPVAAQEGTAVITGQVTAEQGRPLVGATVVITELNAGVQVNDAGRYSLVVPAARVTGQTVTLRARFIGYQPQSKTITLHAGPQSFDFALAVDPTRLSEVVVTGVTGETERQKVPFTVARVDSADMPVQAVNALSQLQGKVPGANIAATSGRPGVAPSVILRGPTSINANGRGQEPLYIVDGVILGSSIADINPADIESVEVVKGAAASSLYGSRAAAGVIQITTKKGRSGSDGISTTARAEYGVNDIEGNFGIARNMPFLLDETGTRFCVLDSYGTNQVCSRTIDYLAEQARINNTPGDFALGPPSFPVDPGAVTSGDILRRAFVSGTYPGKTYDAVKQLVAPKPVSINDISVAGRYGQTSFRSSLGYTEQGGAIQGLKGYNRINGRINLDHRISDQWSLSVNSYYARSDQDGSNQEEGGTGFFRLTRTPAIVDITRRDAFGRLYIRTNLGSGGVQNENPLYSFENIQRSDIRYRFLGGATLKYSPLDWLDADANFSIDRLNLNFAQFQNKNFRTTNSSPATNNGLIFNGVGNTQAINASTSVTARRQLTEKINSRFNVRASYEGSDIDSRSLQGNQLRVGGVTAAANATNIQSITSGIQTTRQVSVSGNTFFDMFDRYTVDLLVREDGNSRFGKDQRFQTYGRGSAAWLAAREPWWPLSQVSEFTLRASVGSAGNVPPYVAQYETYSIGAGGTLSPVTQGNPNLKPEVATEVELGSDLELFSRYGLTLTYAKSDTRNQILPVPRSVVTGFPTAWQNAGTLQNKTWEAALTLPIITGGGPWGWTTRFNYSSNRAVVTKLDVVPFFIGTDLQGTGTLFRIQEGQRYGTFYGREFATSCSQLPANFQSQCGGAGSAFQKNDEGYLVWVGQGNNPGMGVTDNLWNAVLPAGSAPWNAQLSWGMPMLIRDNCTSGVCAPSIRPLGHSLPDYRLGMSHTVTWKKLSLYGLLDGAFGGSAYNQGRHWSYLDFLSHDVDQGGKTVQKAKPLGYYYRVGPADNGAGIGGFYDILGPNSRFVESTSYAKLREVSGSYHVGVFGPGDITLSVIGRNLKTWTRYTGFDPEVGAGVTNSQSGSGIINAVDAFTFPQLRTVSFVLTAGF